MAITKSFDIRDNLIEDKAAGAPDPWSDLRGELFGESATVGPPPSETDKKDVDKQEAEAMREIQRELELLYPPIEFSNNLFETYKKAVASGKPLVVEFSQESCNVCKKLNAETMTSVQVRQFGKLAEWARIDPVLDEDDKGNVERLLDQLRIDAVPTTVVLDVSNKGLRAVEKITGWYGPDEYSKKLADSFERIKKDQEERAKRKAGTPNDH